MAAAGGVWVKSSAAAKGRTFVPKSANQNLFPGDLRGIKTVKSLGGSTGAKLVQDAQGRLYVMKRGASTSPGHLQEEAYTDAAYRALGVDVPGFHVYNTPSGPVKLARFLDNGKLLGNLHGEERKAAVSYLRRGFVADALLGNWDVIGMGADNILVKDGKAYRIDNGGGMRYRAQGQPKGKAWGNTPLELWSMRDSHVNAQTASVFSGLGIGEIAKQAKAIAPKRQALLASLPDALKGTVGKRFDNVQKVGHAATVLLKKGHSESKVDSFLRNLAGGGKWPESDAELVKLFGG